MVVHQPGTWFDEVLSGLSAQDYPNLSHIFFVTTPIVDGVADTTEANRLSSQITGTLAGAVVRVVEGNPGFGRLINETQRIVEGQGGLFCVMHDDVALMPNTIRLLVEELFVSNAAVVAPKLSEWQSPQTLQSVGFGVDRCGEVDPFIEIGERDQEQHDAVRDVFFVSSACMLVRADLFRELGGFSPDITFFGEDLEFCWRAHLGGARVLIAPNAVARHIRAFETRAASPVSQTIVAQNRARTVATLTSRLQLPFVWLQMLLVSTLETFVGVFSGTFRESLASLRATLGLVFDGLYVWRRRSTVRPLRRVAASDIAKLQVKGSARLTRFIRHRRALASQEIVLLADSRKRWKQSSTRTAGVVMLVFFLLVLVGSRKIIFDSSRVVGEMLPFDGGSPTTGAMFANFVSGWWASGFGEAAANPTGLFLVALGTLATFGNPAALQTLMIIGSIFVGLIGMWRLCGAFGNTRVRLAGSVVYAALPLSYESISRGRFSALLCIATVPWLFDLLNRYLETPKGAIVRRTQLVAGAILILGLVFAFTSSIVVVSSLGLGLWGVGSILGGATIREFLLIISIGILSIVGSVLINLPWSLHFVADDWWALLAGDQGVTNRDLGMGSLARLDFGNMRLGFLVLTTYFCVICALIVATTWRRLWAVRAAVLVVGALMLVVLDDRGVLPFQIAEPAAMLAMVACGLAIAVAVCVSVFVETNLSRESDWRRALALIVPVAIFMGVVPAALSVTDGRWNQPETTVASLLVQLPEQPREGNYRTLFVGDRELLPVSTNLINEKISYGVVDDGPLNIASIWAPQHTPMNASVEAAINSLLAQDTIRVGRLVSPLAIRYLVVPLGAESTVEARRLVDAMASQLDLRRTYFARDLVIYENTSWLPIVSVLDQESAVISEQASVSSFGGRELKSAGALLVDKNTVAQKKIKSRFSGGTVHIAVPFDDGWRLQIDGAKLAPRAAFGASTAFDAPIAGVVALNYETSRLRYLFLALQALVWLVLLILAANYSRFRNRI